jgi:hypothetical protein
MEAPKRALDAPGGTVSPSSPVTTLASASINASAEIVVELVEADETPAVVIVRWPAKPTVIHPRRFPDTAAAIAKLFAEAHTKLAALKARRR